MWRWLIGLVVLVGIGVATFMLRPVTGPTRDLTLVGDVARGDDLLRLGGCVACHTDIKNDGAFLAGGAPLQTPFGQFVPPNITPDPEAGIGSWTLAEFSAALSDGMGPGGTHLYPSFPYDNYTLMSDQEVADLYAALKAVAPVPQKAADHALGFPFNIRLAMAGWKNLFFTPARYEPDPTRSELWNRGRYLTLGPAHCSACHTPRNLFGAPDKANELKGSKGGPAGNVPGIDTATLVEIGYTREAMIDVLAGGLTPEFDVLGGEMTEVIEESTVHWSDADREAVAAYLLDED